MDQTRTSLFFRAYQKWAKLEPCFWGSRNMGPNRHMVFGGPATKKNRKMGAKKSKDSCWGEPLEIGRTRTFGAHEKICQTPKMLFWGPLKWGPNSKMFVGVHKKGANINQHAAVCNLKHEILGFTKNPLKSIMSSRLAKNGPTSIMCLFCFLDMGQNQRQFVLGSGQFCGEGGGIR